MGKMLSFFFLSLLCHASAGTVSVRREAVDRSVFNDSATAGCTYAGSILVSHPMSIDKDDKYYVLGSQMLEAAHMSLDAINQYPRCGLVMKDGSHYSLTLQTYGDSSDPDKTARIGHAIIDATDFMFAGYSSALTERLTPIAQGGGKVLISAGSSTLDVFADMDLAFGMLPPGVKLLDAALHGVSKHGAQSVAYVSEEGINSCVGTEDVAPNSGMVFLQGVVLPGNSTLQTYQEIAYNMSLLNPDVVIACLRSNLMYWNQAMRNVDWAPKAQIYAIVVGSPEFEEALGTDLPYVMGVGSWDRALPPVPDGATGWTPLEFDQYFEQVSFRRPVYQHTAQSAAVSVLVQALERVGQVYFDDDPMVVVMNNNTPSPRSTWQEKVRQVLATSYFPTVYGNVSFDTNGQSVAPALLLQYDANHTLHVLLPEDLHFTDFEMVYPLPSWAERDCTVQSKCLEYPGAVCTTTGSCTCPSPLLSQGVRSNATCAEPPDQGDGTLIVAIVVPLVVVVVIVLAVLWIVHQYNVRKNDTLWQVKSKELIYADPPKVIGRGTFGLVLLAEYRGTQVAVKKVLPAIANKKSKSSSSSSKWYSSGGSSNDEQSDINSATKDGTISQRSGFSSGLKSKAFDQKGTMTQRSGFFSSLKSKGSGQDGTPNSGEGSGAVQAFRKKLQHKMQQDFIREMRHVSKLRHPCITTVMGAIISPTEEPQLIMEYMDHGSLYDILHNETMIIEGEFLVPILRDVSQGVRFLHAADPQVIHGDLKAANILVDQKFRAKVADFGLSQKKQMGVTGTPYWMAPELLRHEGLNTAASDVYAFGIILYEAFSRKDPYHDEEIKTKEILRLVADPNVNKRPPVPKDCPPQIASMMCDCLVAEPGERPTFAELDLRLKRVDVKEAEPQNQLSSHVDKSSISLFDIFPKHIAEALRDGKQVEAEHKEEVTIFFCDIVGFTSMSSELDARKVANMLDRLYQRFDTLSHYFDIFKVETIGDAYMAVTNLVQDQSNDHATRIAEFAVAAVKAANETLVDVDDPSRGHVNIRVGFHCGPVVADVVGSRNPRYCLFGDTVNTAARMESNSKKNRIHCSENAANILKQQNCTYTIRSRGEIEVKGKGAMKTFWVEDSGLPERRASFRSAPPECAVPVPVSGTSKSQDDLENSVNLLPVLEPSSQSTTTTIRTAPDYHASTGEFSV